MGCECDFCVGKKQWNDNWCPHCAKVKLEPPKWWENLDVCDACSLLLEDEYGDFPGIEAKTTKEKVGKNGV